MIASLPCGRLRRTSATRSAVCWYKAAHSGRHSWERSCPAEADFDAYMEKIGPDKKNQFMMMLPAGRLGETTEYAALAAHLASDETYCVGQIISPNGGLVF